MIENQPSLKKLNKSKKKDMSDKRNVNGFKKKEEKKYNREIRIGIKAIMNKLNLKNRINHSKNKTFKLIML
jgi:hypothetical protein